MAAYMRADQTLRCRPSAIGTASCSPDNQVAVCAETYAYTQTPSYTVDASNLDFVQVDLDVKSGSVSKFTQIQRSDNDESLSIGAENDPVAIAAEWSPLGLSRMYGCVLAVLDSHHRVSVWEPTGVGINDNWVPTANLTDKLLEETILKDNLHAEGILGGANSLDVKESAKLKTYSTSWSQPYRQLYPYSTEAFLAVGGMSGAITLWSFTRSQGLQFKSRLIFLDSTEPAITQLAWSSWIEVQDTSQLAFDKVSILAASRNDGSVHLVKIMINTKGHDVEILEINENMTRELAPKQRIHVSKLVWIRRENDVILLVARNGLVAISTVSIDNILNFPSPQATILRHENFSPVVDLVISASQEHLTISLVSQLLPIITFRFSSSNELELLPSSTDFDDFFNSKRVANTLPGTQSFFKIYGVYASCNNTVITIYYELHPSDRPQYRRAIDYKSRLSVTIVDGVENAIIKHVAHLNKMLFDRMVSFAKYAWEGKVLYEAASLEQKTLFVTLYLDTFKSLKESAGDETVTEFRTSIEDPSNNSDIASWQYWIAMDRIIDISSDSSLSEDHMSCLAGYKEHAISRIYNYIYESLKSLESNISSPLLSLVIRIYDSFTSSSPESSPEKCGICSDPISSKSRSFGSCARGHLFQRCSVTLMTLSTPFAYTCRICSRKKLDQKAAFVEDPEWCVAVFSENTPDLEFSIPEMEKCVFCGGEWVRKL